MFLTVSCSCQRRLLRLASIEHGFLVEAEGHEIQLDVVQHILLEIRICRNHAAKGLLEHIHLDHPSWAGWKTTRDLPESTGPSLLVYGVYGFTTTTATPTLPSSRDSVLKSQSVCNAMLAIAVLSEGDSGQWINIRYWIDTMLWYWYCPPDHDQLNIPNQVLIPPPEDLSLNPPLELVGHAHSTNSSGPWVISGKERCKPFLSIERWTSTSSFLLRLPLSHSWGYSLGWHHDPNNLSTTVWRCLSVFIVNLEFCLDCWLFDDMIVSGSVIINGFLKIKSHVLLKCLVWVDLIWNWTWKLIWFDQSINDQRIKFDQMMELEDWKIGNGSWRLESWKWKCDCDRIKLSAPVPGLQFALATCTKKNKDFVLRTYVLHTTYFVFVSFSKRLLNLSNNSFSDSLYFSKKSSASLMLVPAVFATVLIFTVNFVRSCVTSTSLVFPFLLLVPFLLALDAVQFGPPASVKLVQSSWKSYSFAELKKSDSQSWLTKLATLIDASLIWDSDGSLEICFNCTDLWLASSSYFSLLMATCTHTHWRSSISPVFLL